MRISYSRTHHSVSLIQIYFPSNDQQMSVYQNDIFKNQSSQCNPPDLPYLSLSITRSRLNDHNPPSHAKPGSDNRSNPSTPSSPFANTPAVRSCQNHAFGTNHPTPTHRIPMPCAWMNGFVACWPGGGWMCSIDV